MELGRFLGGLHPLLVHFPIVLILLGVACDLLAWARRSERLSWAGLWLTLLGTAAVLVAFVCGILAECFAARAGIPQEPMEAHERFATVAAWLFIGLASVRLFLGTRPSRRPLVWYLAGALVGCGLLIGAAHRGARVTYEYGANVAGARPLRGPSDEDLATLAQHQEQRTLTYSDQMHHTFGWLVLALSAAVFCERLRLGRLANLRWLMPLLFLGGGTYLFLFSDWDSWPLSRLRPVTDTEVMLHKAIALMMFAVGLAAVWRRKARPSLLVAPSAAHPRWAWQNKLIAVMALAGGGALFTHIHTNAPYTANAVGVYLNHAVMGLVALATAAVVLWEEARPSSRLVSLLLPALLLTQSILLVRYNEDLPWFLGYDAIDATPAAGGVVAHVPGGRAELVFDAADGGLDLFFWDSRWAVARERASQPLEGTVEASGERTRLEFAAVDPRGGRASHFRSTAEWLRRVPLFALRLGVDGASVEFDPVVTAPMLPPLIGAETVYGCPMCTDTLSSKPGQCPMCGMKLEPIPLSSVRPVSFWDNRLTRARGADDARFALNMQSQPAVAQAGKPVELAFTFRNQADQSIVKEFQVIHGKRLHLLVVSRDLSWFDHVHPEQRDDGRFFLSETFPFAGEFLLFADATPVGSQPRVFRTPIHVEGERRTEVPLRVNDDAARTCDGHQVWLRLTPSPPLAGGDADLTFFISENGKAVDDLGLFLGAAGHCVIIHEDTETFIHTHPHLLTAAVPPPAGPEVTFHAHLPKRGLYKVWGQFNHRGRIITADFVFRAE